MNKLTTTTYDGTVIETHDDRHPSKRSAAGNHRRKVLWHLYMTGKKGINRLPKQDLLSNV